MSVARRLAFLPRALVAVALLAASSVGYAVYGTGVWDPFPEKVLPFGHDPDETSHPAEDQSGFGIGHAPFGFNIAALSRPKVAAISTAVTWQATGKSFVPLRAPEKGYFVEEPRITLEGQDGSDPTTITAPRGRFSSPVAPGPLVADLEGHVHVEESRGSLDTETATLTLPPAHGGAAALGGDASPQQRLQLDKRFLRAQLDATSPVHAHFMTLGGAAVSSGTLAVEAEHGALADADLHRVLLRGPVHAKDDVGCVALEASDHVLFTTIRSRAELMASFDGLAGALGGKEPLVPAMGQHGRSYELERVEAQGAVKLHWVRPGTKDQPAVELDVTGDFVLVDLARGTLLALGSPAVVVERGRGQSIRARLIHLRDLGENRISFAALGGARLGTRLAKVHGSVPPAWWLAGEEAMGTLTNVADPGDTPELDVLDATVWPRPGVRAHAGSDDGRIQSDEDLLTVEKSRAIDANGTEVAGHADTVRAFGRGEPVWLWSRGSDLLDPAPAGAASWLAASEIALTEEKGKPDLLRMSGHVRGHVEGDVARMMSESRDDGPATPPAGSPPTPAGSTSGNSPGVSPLASGPLASGGPWDVRGERVAIDIWPKALDKNRDLTWWERSKVLRAHVEDSAELGGQTGTGAPLHVAGRAIDLDFVKGKLAVAPEARGRVALELGATRVAADALVGDLRTGQVDARGDVHARQQLPPGPGGVARSATLDAPRATAVLETDEARLKTLRQEEARARRQGRRELAPPPEVLAFHADGVGSERAVIATSDGARGEADRFEWDAATARGFARSVPGAPRVHLESPRGSALAREAEVTVAPLASGADYHVELTDEVRIDGLVAKQESTFDVESDRARGELSLRDEAGKPEVSWGPVVAWATGESPVIVSSRRTTPAAGERAMPPTEARGKTLRLFPATSTGLLESAPGERVWVATGTSWIESMRRDPLALEKGLLGAAPIKDALALRAPELQFVYDPSVKKPHHRDSPSHKPRDAKEDKKASSSKVASHLQELRSLHAPGPVFARWNTQTYEATSLDYDGPRRCATLLGPGKVHGEGGHTGTFQRAMLTLDDSGVNDP